MTRYIIVRRIRDVVTLAFDGIGVYLTKEEARKDLAKIYECYRNNNKRVMVSNLTKTEDSIVFDECFMGDDFIWRVEYMVVSFTL